MKNSFLAVSVLLISMWFKNMVDFVFNPDGSRIEVIETDIMLEFDELQRIRKEQINGNRS